MPNKSEVVIKYNLDQLPELGSLSGSATAKFEHCPFITKDPLEIELSSRVKVCYDLVKYGIRDRRVLTKRGRVTHNGELQNWTTIGII